MVSKLPAHFLLAFVLAAAEGQHLDGAVADAQECEARGAALGLLQTRSDLHGPLFQLPDPDQDPGEIGCHDDFFPPTENGTLFVQHIPKCGVCTVLSDLRKMNSSLPMWSMERCYSHRFSNPFFGQHLVMLRNPYEHVHSLYEECNSSDDWPFRMISHETLPDFKTWISQWRELHKQNASGGFRPYPVDIGACYRPVNFMSHLMTCRNNGEFNYTNDVDEHLAIANMMTSDTIGLIDSYQESNCVFHAKFTGALPEYCNCKDPAKWSSFQDVQTQVSHGVAKHSEVEDLTAEEREIVDAITASDWKLYNAARVRFLNDVRAVEKEFGVSIVCEGSPLLK